MEPATTECGTRNANGETKLLPARPSAASQPAQHAPDAKGKTMQPVTTECGRRQAEGELNREGAKSGSQDNHKTPRIRPSYLRVFLERLSARHPNPETRSPKPALSLQGPVRARAIAYAGEVARSVRNHCRVLEVGVGEAMMPAEAVNELDAARACLERMIHRGQRGTENAKGQTPDSAPLQSPASPPLQHSNTPSLQFPNAHHPPLNPSRGVSVDALRSVQQLRGAMDALSHDIERWRVAFPDEEFPETVLDALNQELNRGEILFMRAAEIGREA